MSALHSVSLGGLVAIKLHTERAIKQVNSAALVNVMSTNFSKQYNTSKLLIEVVLQRRNYNGSSQWTSLFVNGVSVSEECVTKGDSGYAYRNHALITSLVSGLPIGDNLIEVKVRTLNNTGVMGDESPSTLLIKEIAV